MSWFPCALASTADTDLLEAICHLNYWSARVPSGPVRSSWTPLQVGRVGINVPTSGALPNRTTPSGGRGDLEDMVLAQISCLPSPTRLSSQPRVIPLAHPGQCLRMRATGSRPPWPSLFPRPQEPDGRTNKTHRYPIREVGRWARPPGGVSWSPLALCQKTDKIKNLQLAIKANYQEVNISLEY